MGDIDKSLWVALESLLGWSPRERPSTPEKDNWKEIVGFGTSGRREVQQFLGGGALKGQGKLREIAFRGERSKCLEQWPKHGGSSMPGSKC